MTFSGRLKTYAAVLRFALASPNRFVSLFQVKQQKLTYLSYSKLISLCQLVNQVETQHVSGIFIEAGCALGGSAVVISKNKAKARDFHIYDTFGMIPPPSEMDAADAAARYQEISQGQAKGIQRDIYYGYQENLLGKVKRTFERFDLPPSEHHIYFHKGLFEHALQVQQPVAFAHIDSDWYDSVTVCLARITPRLSPGGVIVIDDYRDWQGAKKATDDFFADKQDQFSFSYGQHLAIQKLRF